MKKGTIIFSIFSIATIVLTVIGISLKKGGFDNLVANTRLANKEVSIEGLTPFPNKETTNVIIIHGIGNHCIGYADQMISSLLSKHTDEKPKDTRSVYTTYLETRMLEIKENDNARLYAPRDGSCKLDLKDHQSTTYLKKLLANPDDRKKVNNPDGIEELLRNQKLTYLDRIITIFKGDSSTDQESNPKFSIPQQYKTDDLEAVVLGQEAFCEYIHETSDSSTDCYRLYVDKQKNLYNNIEDRMYTTGFIRKISRSITAGHKLNIYELTWSPAVRWLKKSFQLSEIVNEDSSRHVVNRNIKAAVVNNAIADAVAYLSDSGTLINFDVLQTFCLNIATSQNTSQNFDFDFACNKDVLKSTSENFSNTNEVILISHSLGSRILLDSLGLLSRGADSKIKDKSTTLVGVMQEKFKKIGAVVSPYYTSPSTDRDQGFTELLHSRILDYMKSIRAIYLLTNQIPLLTANITSPLRLREPVQVSYGFNDFIEERYKQAKTPLQIYSFHDPDDALSYNFKCWFHMNILNNIDTTKDTVWNEAERRAKKSGKMVGEEYRALRISMFGTTCSKEGLSPVDQVLYDTIWQKQDKFRMVDATVRLNNKRIPFIAADPGGIHSNYFVDKTIHRWILEGNH